MYVVQWANLPIRITLNDGIVIAESREMLREDAIIGISVSNTAEAQKAIEMNAGYVGIGTLFATPTYVAVANASS